MEICYLSKLPPKQSLLFWIRKKLRIYSRFKPINLIKRPLHFVHMLMFCNKLRKTVISLSLQIQSICSYMRNSTFFLCHVILDPAPFIKMCEEELCKCNLTDRFDCACSAFTQYSRACARNKAPIQWRTRDICRKCFLILHARQLNM